MTNQPTDYQQVIAKCWADSAFKQQLMHDPVGTLRQEGYEIPQGLSIKIAENTEQELTLVIPLQPTALSDEQLEGVTGGTMMW